MMKIYIRLFAGISLLLFCCQKPESNSFNDYLISLHKSLDSITPDSAIYYLKTAENQIKVNPTISDSLKAENAYLLGIHFRKIGRLDSAAYYFQNATYFVTDEINNNRDAEYFLQAWTAYHERSNFGDCLAISNRFKSLINEQNTYKNHALYYYLFFLESTYYAMEDYEKALENNQRLIDLVSKTNDTVRIIPSLMSRSRLLYTSNRKRESFRLMDSLLTLNSQLSIDQKRVIYSDYGVYSFYEGDFKKAISFYKTGIENTKKTTNSLDKKSLLATGYANLAEAYLEIKDYNSATAYLDSIESIGFNNIEERLQRSVLKYQLRISFETDKDIGKVITYLDSIFKFKDQLYREKFNNELLALTKANEKEQILLAEKQVAEVENLQLQNRFIFVLLGSLLLGVIGVLWYRQRKFKFEKQGLQMQQRLLRSQMNPHFTFNTLYAIQNTIKEDQQVATDYLLKFSRLLRLILENSMLDYVPIEDELDSLKKYMELQLLRFPGKFSYNIEGGNLDEEETLFIPPMLLQPFVENTIEHGFSGIDYVGIIQIRLRKQGNFIHCNIEDNGRGLVESQNPLKSSASIELISNFLLKATKTRIEIINKKRKDNNFSGVNVSFLIPFKYTKDD